MGKPIIASAIGAAPEIVIPGQTGWLVPPGVVSALADALEKALSLTATERAELASLAQQRVKKLFSVDAMCEKTLSVYRELLL